MQRLANTGATLIVANIPDVTVIPYLTSAEKFAAQTPYPLSVIGPILGIGPGDFLTPDAFPLIPAIIANPALGPLPGNVVLNSVEVIAVQREVRRRVARIYRKFLLKIGDRLGNSGLEKMQFAQQAMRQR